MRWPLDRYRLIAVSSRDYRMAEEKTVRSPVVLLHQEAIFEVVFHGQRIGRFKADLVVEESVVIEVKAARRIDQTHWAQLVNYLRASAMEVGLLLNFGRRAEFRRVISSARKPTEELVMSMER